MLLLSLTINKLLVKHLLRTLLISALAVCSVRAQDSFDHTITYLRADSAEAREHPLDITRMKVTVTFDPLKSLVRGVVQHSYKVLRQRVDSVVFDAVDITIKQAMLNGAPVRYTNSGKEVVVYCEPPLHWDSTGVIQFTYEATPKRGLFFIGWADTTATMRRQVWTQGQATDHRHWIPMYDEMNDKMITETVVTFDSAYTVISNGNRISTQTNGDGTRTWHYTMPKPHSSYLLMLAIGKYAVTYDTSGGGVPLEQYWYPDRPQDAEPTYRYSKEGMDFLEREIGLPYQWGVYKQVPAADYVFGAMENTTATIFGDFYLRDARGWLDRSYIGTNTHELTHQWFGDLVTGRSIQSLWLQESFATFYPLLFSKHIYGVDEYQWQRRGMQNAALSAGARDRYPIVHPKAGGSRVYPKGAVVLDMMRTVFGEEAQRRVILHYLKHHAFGNVETNDLYLSFQDTLGLSPRWFFDQWLYRSGEPTFDVTYSTGSRNDVKGTEAFTTLIIRQTHFTDALTGYFSMPIVCEAHYTDGTKDSVTAQVDGQTTIVEIPNPDARDLAFVLFDPGSAILKNCNFHKPWEMLMEQARNAPFMLDRLDAMTAAAADTTHAKELGNYLLHVMNTEQHQAMRAEAVSLALGKIGKGLEASQEIVLKALADRSVEVRKRALSAMTEVTEPYRGAVEQLLTDSSYAVIESALRRLCSSFPNNASSYIAKTADVVSPHAQVEIARAELLAAMNNPNGVQTLEDLASNRYEFTTRRSCFSALTRLGNVTPKAIEGMLDACISSNWRLADAARAAITTLATQTAIRTNIRSAIATIKTTEEQRQKLLDMVR